MSVRLAAGLAIVFLGATACASNQPQVAAVSFQEQVAVAEASLRDVPPILSITPTYYPDNQAAAPAPRNVYRAQQ